MYALPRGTFFRSRRRTRPAARTVRRSAIRGLLLRRGLLTACDSLARSLAGASVGSCSLAVDRQPAAVADAAIAVDLHQPLDVQVDFTSQIAFDGVFTVDDLAQTGYFVLAEVARAAVRGDGRPRQDFVRRRGTDPENVGQRDPDLFVARNVNAGDTCH